MPWEVDEWPDEWVSSICSLVDDLPALEAMEKARQAYAEKWQAERRKGKRHV